MRWEIFLIPAIATIVAIVASIIRGIEEAKQREAQIRRNGTRRERERPEPSGMDQFLEEIRRRQASRQEEARAAQRAMRKSRERPESPEETPAPPPAPVAPPPVRREPQAEAPVVVVAVPAMEVPLVRPVPILPAPVLAPKPADEKANANRERLAELLKSRAGLQTAFLLREILDAPKCRKNR